MRPWKIEAEIRVIPWLEGIAIRGMGSSLQKMGRQGADSPLEPPEATQPCQQLDYRTSGLQNFRIMHLYCFQPLKVYSKLLQWQQETNPAATIKSFIFEFPPPFPPQEDKPYPPVTSSITSSNHHGFDTKMNISKAFIFTTLEWRTSTQASIWNTQRQGRNCITHLQMKQSDTHLKSADKGFSELSPDGCLLEKMLCHTHFSCQLQLQLQRYSGHQLPQGGEIHSGQPQAGQWSRMDFQRESCPKVPGLDWTLTQKYPHQLVRLCE